ncbi:MAG: class I SAM-dependent methyltransferase [Armatimonadetes bacterium]|nr:class I SAM-dependent methyltransferase [Armatimonadota bacterium]
MAAGKSPIVSKLRERLARRVTTVYRAYGDLVAKQLTPDMVLLDVGCGAHFTVPINRSRCPQLTIWCLDPDPAAASNPDLHRFFLLVIDKPWPLPDASVDIATASAVLEHVDDPAGFMSELARVLKPGGKFVFYAPNRHYPLITAARLMPHSLKVRLLTATGQRHAEDVFPATYQMNTKAALARAAREAGLHVDYLAVRDFEPSGYLDFCLAGFLASCTCWAISRGTQLSRWFGPVLMGVLTKAAPG